jgi:hypothetical protein
VPTAQLDAWATVQGGALDDTASEIEESLADAALAQMMLHRRRAVVPEVINEFFVRAGDGFAPYLGGLAPAAPLDFPSEMAEAKEAAAIAERACGSVMPLLFERAMVAEAEGRSGDAAADLDRLLQAYPGFVTAAFAAGRVALADGDALRAIEVLAYVERELVQTREGAGLLAVALRGIGMAEAASRYDVAELTGAGHADSRGNDCAPVDVAGNFVWHRSMPPAFYVEHLPNGHALYNDRGVYYFTNSAFSDLFFAIFRSNDPAKRLRRRPRPGSISGPISDAFRVLLVRLKPVVYKTTPAWKTVRAIPVALVYVWRQLTRLRRGSDRSLRRILPQLAAWGLLQIPDRDRHSEIARARLRSGIAAIFGSSLDLALAADRRLGSSVSHTPTNAGADAAREPERKHDEASLEAVLLKVSVSGTLPPMAVQALQRLVSHLDTTHDETLQP